MAAPTFYAIFTDSSITGLGTDLASACVDVLESAQIILNPDDVTELRRITQTITGFAGAPCTERLAAHVNRVGGIGFAFAFNDGGLLDLVVDEDDEQEASSACQVERRLGVCGRPIPDAAQICDECKQGGNADNPFTERGREARLHGILACMSNRTMARYVADGLAVDLSLLATPEPRKNQDSPAATPDIEFVYELADASLIDGSVDLVDLVRERWVHSVGRCRATGKLLAYLKGLPPEGVDLVWLR